MKGLYPRLTGQQGLTWSRAHVRCALPGKRKGIIEADEGIQGREQPGQEGKLGEQELPCICSQLNQMTRKVNDEGRDLNGRAVACIAAQPISLAGPQLE